MEKRCQQFTYDNAVDGDMPTNAAFVLGTLPKGALVTGGLLYIVTDVTDADDGDNTTISFGFTGSAAAFIAATAVSSLEATNRICILPGNPALGSDATTLTDGTSVLHAAEVAKTFEFQAADIRVIATVSNDVAIDAGKFNLFVEYYVTN